jgi:hypothetical protein
MQSAWKTVLRHKTREIMKRLQQASQACNQLFNIEQMFWLKNIIKRKKNKLLTIKKQKAETDPTIKSTISKQNKSPWM